MRLKSCKNVRTARLGQNLLVLILKKCIAQGGWEGGGVAAWKGRSSNICIRRCSRTIEATSSSKGNGLLFLACLYRVIDAIGKLWEHERSVRVVERNEAKPSASLASRVLSQLPWYMPGWSTPYIRMKGIIVVFFRDWNRRFGIF